jgi:SnoaL-like domain
MRHRLGLSCSMPDQPPGQPDQPPGQPPALRAWHAAVASADLAVLDGLLADEVVFRSPAVFTPQAGKARTAAYLAAAFAVLGPSLRYLHEWHDPASAVLEFEAELEGAYVQGVDMLRWDSADQLVSVTVLVRPLRGLEKLIELMSRQLAAGQP